MRQSNEIVSLLNLKKIIRDRFPHDSVTREFVLRLPDKLPGDEFKFLAKTLEILMKIETERTK